MLRPKTKLRFRKPGESVSRKTKLVFQGSFEEGLLSVNYGKAFEEDIVDIDPISATTFVYNPHVSLPYEQQRQRLPIYNYRSHILYLLQKYQTLVLVGETGCGKSTQLPQYLLEAGWAQEESKGIAITEPRRVAATSLASRVAEEKGCQLGDLVGYVIRFDDCTTPNVTKIKYMTEGILMREIMSDPLLRQYSVIILDEAHERTLHTDIIMGLMKKILKKNTALKLIVSSATVDAEEMQFFFNFNRTKDKTKDTSVIMSVTGRMYSTDIYFRKEPVPDYVQGVVETVLKIHKTEGHGDILAFLTGQEEVERAVMLLREGDPKSAKGWKLQVQPMHGSLPNSEQLKVFRPAEQDHRKAVIATNIAETSVTISGIVYVVDCGFVKMRWFNPDTFTDSLVVVPVSKSSAQQRAGRAGRVRTGKVFRLYSEGEYEALAESTSCEMQRTDLSLAVLHLKALGIDNVLRFNFPAPPPAKNLAAAMELLFALGGIDEDGKLTPLGSNMAEFPMHPLYSKMLLTSGEFGCSEEILTIVSALQVQTIFTKPVSGALAIKARVAHRKFEVAEGDLLTLLNAYTAYQKMNKKNEFCHKHFLNQRGLKRVTEIREKMLSLLKKFGVPIVSAGGNGEAVLRAITAGLFQNAAYFHHSGVYRSIRGDQDLHVHSSSVLYTLVQAEWVLFCDLVSTNKRYIKNLTVVKPEWLEELAPHFYQRTK